jgi:hypothetical protein
MTTQEIINLINNNLNDVQILGMGVSQTELDAAKAEMAKATAKPKYVKYGSGRAQFGRSRNVKVGEQFILDGTESDRFNDNEFTRWRFKRSDGSKWAPSESSVSMWVREFYPQFAGKASDFFDYLVNLGQLTVSEVKVVENDFGNKVQCVKF